MTIPGEIRKILGEMHGDRKREPMRAARFNQEGQLTDREASGCFGYLSYGVENRQHYAAIAFHGSGVDCDFEAVKDHKVFGRRMIAAKKDLLHFEGNATSLDWVRFITDTTKSPWRACLPYLLDTDPEYINDNGFVFGLKDVPYKLFYNFVMAMRYYWENPQCFAAFNLLRPVVKDDSMALFISSNFVPHPESKDVQGRWKLIYPWSFLEGGGLQSIGRFVRGRPKELTPLVRAAPNVSSLWDSNTRKLDNLFRTAAGEDLSQIVPVLWQLVDEQEKTWSQ